MQLKQLSYFCEVANCGTISQAAKNLYMAQPSLSQSIQQLEQELGFPLLRRQSGGVELTPMGSIVLEDARRLLADAEEMRLHWLEINRDRFLPSGLVRIMSCPTVHDFIDDNVAQLLSQTYPNVSCCLMEARQNMFCEMFDHDGIDFAVSDCPASDEEKVRGWAEANGLEFLIVGRDEWKLAIRSDHPLAAKEDLAAGDVHGLSLAHYSGHDEVAIPHFGRFFDRGSMVSFHSLEKIIQATIRGQVVSALSVRMIEDGFRRRGEKCRLRFVSIEGYTLPGIQFLCCPKGRTLSPAASLAKDLCLSAFRDCSINASTIAAMLRKKYRGSPQEEL